MGGLGSTGTGTGVIGTHSKVHMYMYTSTYTWFIQPPPPHGVAESPDVDHFSHKGVRSELIVITDGVSVSVAGPSVPTRVRTQLVGNIFSIVFWCSIL